MAVSNRKIAKTKQKQLPVISDPESKDQFIEALSVAKGIVSKAAKETGINSAYHYRWLMEDEAYKARVAAVEEEVLDWVEGKFHENLDRKDTISMIFYLKTKAKRRGYIERSEVDMNSNISVSWNESKSYDNSTTEGDTAT